MCISIIRTQWITLMLPLQLTACLRLNKQLDPLSNIHNIKNGELNKADNI